MKTWPGHLRQAVRSPTRSYDEFRKFARSPFPFPPWIEGKKKICIYKYKKLVELFNLFFLMKLCQRLWNPQSVTCCDSGTASPLHQGPARRWHMMDFGALLFPSPDWRDCLGTVAGPWQAGPSSMPHLDQHSALPPESITVGCDKAAHLFITLFFYFKSRRMMRPLLPGGGDYDVVEAVQMDDDAFIEVWCIRYFLINA